MGNKSFTYDPKLLQFLKEDIRKYRAGEFSLDFMRVHSLDFPSLVHYSYHHDKRVSFRSAWLLEHLCIQHPDLIKTCYTAILVRLSEQKHWGAIRSYTKIMMLASHPKTGIPHSKKQEEILIERCFHWIIDPKCPVAVLVNCLDILCHISLKHPWIQEELKDQIAHLLRTPTSALASRARRILKRIN